MGSCFRSWRSEQSIMCLFVIAPLICFWSADATGAEPSGAGPSARPSFPAFDFTQPSVVSEWKPAHDVGPLDATAQGAEIQIRGKDPYVISPARDYPSGMNLWLRLRLKSDAG